MRKITMMIVVLVASTVAVGLAACGPDADLVASGKAHSCSMKALQSKLEANPADVDTQNKLRESAEYLKVVIDTADQGDRAALQKAIQEAVAKGCP